MSSSVLGALAELGSGTWLVGGAVRDRARGVDTGDLDVVLAGELVEPAARRLARGAGGHAFQLSAGFGVWRVVAHDHSWQVDLTPLAGETIEDDLAQRDFTINAIAEPVVGGRSSIRSPGCGISRRARCGWSRRTRSRATRCG